MIFNCLEFFIISYNFCSLIMCFYVCVFDMCVSCVCLCSSCALVQGCTKPQQDVQVKWQLQLSVLTVHLEI